MRRPGRPKLPVSQVTNDALWKRAQRADNRPPSRGMIRHHLDGAYGRKSARTVYISRGEHNRRHKRRQAVRGELSRRKKARKV